MDETAEQVSPNTIPESPKPLAFTIDFGEGKSVDTERYKSLVEKYQHRHRRGQSLSKFDEAPSPPPSAHKKHPLTGNLPRKSGFHTDGYYSSDEKADKLKCQGVRSTVLNTVISKGELTLPLRDVRCERRFELPSINSPEIELKDVSSPELDLVSPVSPQLNDGDTYESEVDKTDTLSDTGTYTLDADNYTEEQKARMSIDKYLNLEQVSDVKKAQEYVESLTLCGVEPHAVKPLAADATKTNTAQIILSQNTVQTETIQYAQKLSNNAEYENTNRITKKIFNKVLYPKYQLDECVSGMDQGVFTSITASGVLSKRRERAGHTRRASLTQSEIFVEAYTGDAAVKQQPFESARLLQCNIASLSNANGAAGGGPASPTKIPSPVHTMTRARSRNSWSTHNHDLSDSSLETESYLKPTQNIITSLQARLSIESDPDDSDCDKTYNNAVALNNETKQRLLKHRTMHVRHNSFDDRHVKISNKLEHFHNKSLQQRGIDQTLVKTCNQYSQNRAARAPSPHRIQNSPNNSPIRRSSSFSLKNHLLDSRPKCLNKDANVNAHVNAHVPSPHLHRNGSVQRSASTANIKPNVGEGARRASISSSSSEQQHKPQYTPDTESSTDDEHHHHHHDYNKTQPKNKKDLTATRYNRAFSLRRARLEHEPVVPPRCPNTPEMRRKFGDKPERTVSVDRKGARATGDVPSRYLNIARAPRVEPGKPAAPKQPVAGRPPLFSRTDTGRFSMRTPRPTNAAPKPPRRDQQGKKQSGGGARSNSTLSSREVEFQNWKRRKSYDPMKAAAEGKRKAELARKQNQPAHMTQSYNEANSQDCDSSPSHSSSVHRSQSFHGTAALEHQLISSDDDDEEEDLTLSGDDGGFSPPTPSPAKSNLRNIWAEKFTRSKR